MSAYHIIGNLLDSQMDYICHQVNCQGKMGSGIAKSIREKWPIVYARYMEWYHGHYYHNKIILGDIQLVQVSDKQVVINMAAQDKYGYDGKRYTDYEAFYSCLEAIKKNVPMGSSIGFPYKIGCVRGGANWNIIKTMIIEVLGYNYNVVIYEYDGG